MQGGQPEGAGWALLCELTTSSHDLQGPKGTANTQTHARLLLTASSSGCQNTNSSRPACRAGPCCLGRIHRPTQHTPEARAPPKNQGRQANMLPGKQTRPVTGCLPTQHAKHHTPPHTTKDKHTPFTRQGFPSMPPAAEVQAVSSQPATRTLLVALRLFPCSGACCPVCGRPKACNISLCFHLLECPAPMEGRAARRRRGPGGGEPQITCTTPPAKAHPTVLPWQPRQPHVTYTPQQG
jgi:hypothetical protein